MSSKNIYVTEAEPGDLCTMTCTVAPKGALVIAVDKTKNFDNDDLAVRVDLLYKNGKHVRVFCNPELSMWVKRL